MKVKERRDMTLESEHPKEINFESSVDEQLLLAQIQTKSVMLFYKEEELLLRLLAMIILYNIAQNTSKAAIPRILFLTKRKLQEEVKQKMKKLLNKTVTIHNGGILPVARKKDYNLFSIIISTPKTVKNDLKENFFLKNHFSLVFIDHAEIGASSSSLRFLANHLDSTQFIGITRDQNLEKIKQACINLKLKEVLKVHHNESSTTRNNIQHLSFPLPKEYWFVLKILDRIKTNEVSHL